MGVIASRITRLYLQWALIYAIVLPGSFFVSDHRGVRQLLLADPGKFRLSAGEQTTDGLDQDHVC